MEDESVQQCINICRFCGTYHEFLKPITMFTEDVQTFSPNAKTDEQKKLINIVKILLGINLNISDNLPKFVCIICYDKLILINEFRQQCLLTIENLTNKYDNSKHEVKQIFINCQDPVETHNEDIHINHLEDLDYMDGNLIKIEIEEIDQNQIKYEEMKYNNTNKNRLKKINANKVKRTKTTEPKNSDDIIIKPKIKRQKKKMICPICGVVRSNMSTHIQQMHTTVDKHYECDICGRIVKTKSKLKAHLFTIHLNIKKHKCDLCGKAFGDFSTLRLHMNRHEAKITPAGDTIIMKTLPYACEICNRHFKLPSSLTSHQKMHSDDRKYVCATCGTAFKRHAHLRIHINSVHLKLKPFTCEECGKSFVQRGDINIHMRLHTGERPFKCIYCNKSYREFKQMRMHMRFHTGEKVYHCEICNLYFSTYPLLRNHHYEHLK